MTNLEPPHNEVDEKIFLTSGGKLFLTPAPLGELRDTLQGHANPGDLALVGDGSGSKWGLPIGWAAALIRLRDGRTRLFQGGMDTGTVSIAEMFAYFAPLDWLQGQQAKIRARQGAAPFVRVHLMTDSQYVAQRGAQKPPRGHCAHQPLWGAFDAYRRHGLLLHWHWIRRDVLALNRWADAASKASRRRFLNPETP